MQETLLDLHGSAAAPVDPIARHLHHENDVIRCAALRAFAANAPAVQARPALLAALTDPDPDIRTDAMEALVNLARPEDADDLRRSLQGDPVREVKTAAIAALGGLGDTQVTALLRQLVHSRTEDSIAWEDDGGDWDDWLDVQMSAIRALGSLGAREATEDLLAARNDEFGQDIDDAVFDALGKFGQDGIGTLVQIVLTEAPRSARRALATLVGLDMAALQPFLEPLLAADTPEIRAMAVEAMASEDPRAVAMAASDPSPVVRQTALKHIAPVNPTAVEVALRDPDETVQAQALTLLDGKVSSDGHDTLVDNLLAWLQTAGPALASAAARALPVFAPNRCEAPLLAILGDETRALEVRLAAVHGLVQKTPAAATGVFADTLSNPARQIRAAALAEIDRRSGKKDTDATEILVAAIKGDLNRDTAKNRPDASPHQAAPHDAAMPKAEAGPHRIRITRDGDIVEGEAAPQGSTLQQIIAAGTAEAPPRPMAEDTPEEAPAKRRRRRPVEGPPDFAAQFRLDAIGVAAGVPDAQIETALLHAATNGNDDTRRAAWSALSKWPAEHPFCDQTRDAAAEAMQDTDPVRQMAAFDILAKGALPPEALRLALESNDALLRAAAVRFLPAEAALDFLADDGQAVRLSAVAQVIRSDEVVLAQRAVGLLVDAERADTLGELIGQSVNAWRTALNRVGETQVPKHLLVLLEAFAAQTRTNALRGGVA